MKYRAHCSNCGNVEITKPMEAEWPSRHECGGTLIRLFDAPIVVRSNTSDPYVTDVSRSRRVKSIPQAKQYVEGVGGWDWRDPWGWSDFW